MDPVYDIYSTGQLVNAADPAQTRAALARLFKTTEDKITHLMAGKPQLIKRGVEKNEALRYKAALYQAGLLVAVKLAETADSASQTSTATVEKPQGKAEEKSAGSAGETAAAASYAFSLAPAGSDLLRNDEKHSVAARDIDTSAIKLAPAAFFVDTDKTPSPPPPDTTHLTLAAAGSQLGSSDTTAAVATPDISHLTLAEAGALLEELKPAVSALNPDTSQLSLAETGADVMPPGYEKPAPPPSPSTDHITLQTD